MGFKRLFFGETGHSGPCEPGFLMLNIREFFPGAARFYVCRQAGMIIDSFRPARETAGRILDGEG
jgi:hypothetical protein